MTTTQYCPNCGARCEVSQNRALYTCSKCGNISPAVHSYVKASPEILAILDPTGALQKAGLMIPTDSHDQEKS